MNWAPKRPKHDWRAYLTKEEARLVARYDELEAERSALAAEMQTIRNRAIQRAKYDKGDTAYHRGKKR